MRRVNRGRRGRTRRAGYAVPSFLRQHGRAGRSRRGPSHGIRIAILAGILGLAVAIVLGAPVWWWQSGRAVEVAGELYGRALAASAEHGLAVRKVLCRGRNETSRAAILEALKVKRGQPILAFDPQAAKERLEALVWVRTAAVERRLPDTIAVRLSERRPLALWQRNGRLLLVDEEGVVLLRDGLERFAGLPLIVGKDAPRHAPALLAMLSAEPALESRVTAAVRVGGRRWNLRLDNGIDVLLPEEGAEDAWRRLADLERRHGLLGRDVTAVDLRVPDRLVVRLSPGAVQRARDPGRNT